MQTTSIVVNICEDKTALKQGYRLFRTDASSLLLDNCLFLFFFYRLTLRKGLFQHLRDRGIQVEIHLISFCVFHYKWNKIFWRTVHNLHMAESYFSNFISASLFPFLFFLCPSDPSVRL